MTTNQWGLYFSNSGQAAITAESVIKLGYSQDWSISDYPLEQGAFESYNKVQEPFKATIRFAQGGTVIDRQAFLNILDTNANALTLYDLVMPDSIYQNVNITNYSFERTANQGLVLIQADVRVEEVRETITTAFTSTQQPQSQDPVQAGTVQAGNVSTVVNNDAFVIVGNATNLLGH